MEALAARVLAAVRARAPARVSAGWAIGDGRRRTRSCSPPTGRSRCAKRAGKDRVLAAAWRTSHVTRGRLSALPCRV